jgi:hypothetical protein
MGFLFHLSDENQPFLDYVLFIYAPCLFSSLGHEIHDPHDGHDWRIGATTESGHRSDETIDPMMKDDP